MEMTEKQQAWWFVTHPQYSHGRKGSKRCSRAHTEKGSSKIHSEDVDAYVDNALQYADESVAQLLKSVKRNFGTAAQNGENRTKNPSSSTSGASHLPEETWKERLLWHYVDFKNARRNFFSTMDQARQHAIENLGPIFPHIFSPLKKPGYKDAVDLANKFSNRFPVIMDRKKTRQTKKLGKIIEKGAELLDAAERAKDVVDSIRPSWQQTEFDVGKKYEPGTVPQQSFKSGKKVRYGLKGSIRVDQYHPRRKIAIEAKNQNLQTARGRSNFVYKATKQIKRQRLELPKNVRPLFEIDTRGQKVSKQDINNIKRKIVERSDGIIRQEDINILYEVKSWK